MLANGTAQVCSLVLDTLEYHVGVGGRASDRGKGRKGSQEENVPAACEFVEGVSGVGVCVGA